tara:strand:- start:41482 stop:41985 length:504 start_codon:yes stop_codon:yes gene_type:complete
MAIAIDTFNKLRGVAYSGQVSDINVARIDSGSNLGSPAIAFGDWVAVSGGGDGVKSIGAVADAKDILGVAVRTPAWENASSGAPSYAQYDIVSYLKSGRIFVKVNGGCTRGNNAFARTVADGAKLVGQTDGATDAGKNIEITGVKFAQTVADGEFVELVLDGNLVTG